MSESHRERRERLLELLRRHAWNSTSFQLLEPAFRAWFAADAAVGYVQTRRARVAAGPPLAALEQLGAVAQQFVDDARAAGKAAVFFGVEERFLLAIGMNALEVGLQPWWNPAQWGDRIRSRRSLREQLRRARAKGLHVRRLSTAEVIRHRALIVRLAARWQATRPMPPMRFVVELEPFAFPDERRYYAASRDSHLDGLLVAVPIYQRNGWFFEDILRDPDAPNGTAESLIDAAMRDVAADGAEFVTLGLAPLAGDARWHRVLRRLLSGFYNFEGLRAFKAKLRPDGWSPIYAAWPGGGSAVMPLFHVLDAFAEGRIVGFAMRAAARGPAPVLFAAGLAAIPWSLLLASSRTSRWFPDLRVQRAWVAFDLAMAAALLSLARRWRRPLALAAAVAAGADVVATVGQAVAFNARRTRGWADWLVIGAAVAAPAALFVVLYGGLSTRREQRRVVRTSATSQS